MGVGMIRNLLKGGFEVIINTRTRSKAEDLLKEGARWADSPCEVAKETDVVLSIVGYPRDVESVYLGTKGILEGASAGTTVIDMTTSSPDLARRIYDTAQGKGVHSLDAPVSGGDLGARNGTLSIMVGGDEAVFEEMLPVFEAMGGNVVYQGKAGSGQYAKLANQIAIASGIVGACEAMHFAKCSGLDPFKVLKSIQEGAAGSWALSHLMPRALKGDFAAGFYVKYFVKDMGIALEVAEGAGLSLPGLERAKLLYKCIEQAGGGNLGTQSLFDLYERGAVKGISG